MYERIVEAWTRGYMERSRADDLFIMLSILGVGAALFVAYHIIRGICETCISAYRGIVDKFKGSKTDGKS